MKRIRCPKCENYLTFDETKYTEGQSLVFVCENCKKQFSIRLGKTKMKAPQKEENPDETEYKEAFGSITVIENVFGFKQVLPLQEGDNKIGPPLRRDGCQCPDRNLGHEHGSYALHYQCEAQQARQPCLYPARRPQPDGYFPEQ